MAKKTKRPKPAVRTRTTSPRAAAHKKKPVTRKAARRPRTPARAPSPAVSDFRTSPLTPALWTDLERLFGANGACGGCWCMAWRLPKDQWEAGKGEGNRIALHHVVQAGPPPGVLGFDGETPIGWCAVAPRARYDFLSRSRVLKPLNSLPVWSVSCFYIAKAYRARGVAIGLLTAAVEFARGRGARAVEGYPVIARSRKLPDAFAWTGVPGIFRAAGFHLAGRHSAARPIYRILLDV